MASEKTGVLLLCVFVLSLWVYPCLPACHLSVSSCRKCSVCVVSSVCMHFPPARLLLITHLSRVKCSIHVRLTI